MSNLIDIEIRRRDGKVYRQEVAPGTYPVGSDKGNKIELPSPEVSARHAVLTLTAENIVIEDLGSLNGTFIDGRRITGRCDVRDGQLITIGSFAITITRTQLAAIPPVPAERPAAPPDGDQLLAGQKLVLKAEINRELLARLDIKRISAAKMGQHDLSQRALQILREIVQELGDQLPAGVAPGILIKEIHDEALGLGPLEDLLADDEVTEIMVNGPSQVFVERRGKLELTDRTFLNADSVLGIIERIVAPLGRRIDESQPYVDARLKDGSRVNAIIHPLSLVGPCLTIRKFARTPFTDKDLVRFGTWAEPMTEFLKACVRMRKNIIISGGTGSGKTTLLNVVSSYLPRTERIVTIEDAAELRLDQPHVVRLEARPPNIEGKGAIAIRDLVRNALRMRPDRIVVGECRGGEALDMLQAMNTGHDGSLTTVHANSPRDVISRLETMVLMSGMDLPVRAIREQVASAIDLIVHEARMSDGSRKVTHVTELVGMEGDMITMQDIFIFKQTGMGRDHKVEGFFTATGSVPTFTEEMQMRGIPIDHAIFKPESWPQRR